MNIIITMAGKGARFSDVGYPMPKPLIEVENKHVIEWTTRSLPFIEHYNKKTKQVIHFAVRKIDDEKFSIGLRLKKIYGNKIKVHLFDKMTRGNLETAYIVSQKLKENKKDILILDSDNHYDGKNLLNFINVLKSYNSIFAVTCDFEPLDNSSKWCFAIKEGYKVKSLLEKDETAISKGGKPMVGVFYFSQLDHFKKTAKFIMNQNELVKDEFFMSQAVNLYLKSNLPVFSLNVKNVVPLGTPGDIIKTREQEYTKFLKL